MPEGISFFEASAFFENPFLGQNLIDAIQTLLWVAAAALKDKSLLVLHTTELLR